MKCFSCGNEVARMYPDGCETCHQIARQTGGGENRLSQLRASLERVENGTAVLPSPALKPVVPASQKKPVEQKATQPMSAIRWTLEEQQQVAAEVARLYSGKPFAAKAIKEAQAVLPADRRKPSIGPINLGKIRALIPGAESPGRGSGRARTITRASRRAAPAETAAPAILQPIAAEAALPTSDALADLIGQQLARAVIGITAQALENAAGRLRSGVA